MSREHDKGMSLIVKTITRLTVGLILLYGIYIVLHGHVSPGGGFAGGVIIALSFIHLMLAYGKEVAFRKFSKKAASISESIGALMFLSIAILGFLGGFFFLNIYLRESLLDYLAQVLSLFVISPYVLKWVPGFLGYLWLWSY